MVLKCQTFDSRNEEWGLPSAQDFSVNSVNCQAEGSGLTLSGAFFPLLKVLAWAQSNGSKIKRGRILPSPLARLIFRGRH